MVQPTPERRSGLEYLAAVTDLLNRIRMTDPTAGLFEAAELQWWWAQYPRVTDDAEQLFWFDDHGHPVAGVILTDWAGETQLDPLVLPDADPAWVDHVMRRGLAHAAACGFDNVQLEVDKQDQVLRSVLANCGFLVTEDGLTESWMDVADKPLVSPLADGYRLLDRGRVVDRPHHMKHERRNHIDPETRLAQTSLYRPDLDLVVYRDDEVAAYGLFWFNPATKVGVVEPMRTEDGHQQHGLARHVLTSGIVRLADAGAERIKICFDPGNLSAKHLYQSAGFAPGRHNDIFAGPIAAR